MCPPQGKHQAVFILRFPVGVISSSSGWCGRAVLPAAAVPAAPRAPWQPPPWLTVRCVLPWMGTVSARASGDGFHGAGRLRGTQLPWQPHWHASSCSGEISGETTPRLLPWQSRSQRRGGWCMNNADVPFCQAFPTGPPWIRVKVRFSCS